MGAMMTTVSLYASKHCPTALLAGYFRKRAQKWRGYAATVPNGSPQQTAYQQIAEGYEQIATLYETRARLEQE